MNNPAALRMGISSSNNWNHTRSCAQFNTQKMACEKSFVYPPLARVPLELRLCYGRLVRIDLDIAVLRQDMLPSSPNVSCKVDVNNPTITHKLIFHVRVKPYRVAGSDGLSRRTQLLE